MREFPAACNCPRVDEGERTVTHEAIGEPQESLPRLRKYRVNRGPG